MADILFGLNLPTAARPGSDPVDVAADAEALGFDFVSSNDHPAGTHPAFEVWTLLAWIAAKTQKIAVLTRVLGVPYRPPPIVAKMAESLDRLSEGRLILGLGAGASDEEFRAFGIRVPSAKQKIDGLEEALRIIRGLWSRPGFSFEGRLYRTEHADLEPKPERMIPIWVGAFGPRGLDVTGRLADGWIPSYDLAPPERAVRMRERLRNAATEAGRNPDEIRCVYNLEVRVDTHGSDDPGVISGTSQHISRRLLEFVTLGFNGFNFIPVGPEEADQRARLANDVMPLVRQEGPTIGA